MEIIFNPPVNEENKYIQNMVRPLKEHGFRVHALDNFFSSWKHFHSVRLVHLNWFENLDESSIFRALTSFFKKMIVLTTIKVSGKKLVWTMHNRISHEKKTSLLSNWIRYFLIHWSHRIIIHSEISRSLLVERYSGVSAKIFYLPHPEFIGDYGPIPIHEPDVLISKPLVLLFMGAVKPYKNLELLIKAVSPFKERVKLIIAGNPNSDAYRHKIIHMASPAGNIDLRLKFIPDHEIPSLVQESDVLVLPYDLISSLNSGTVLLAFSYRKTVICPEIGTIEDLGPLKNNVFHYHYKSEEEHLHLLSQKIEAALNLKITDPNGFYSLGSKMYDYVKQCHHKNLVGKNLINLYLSLLN
jgi:glycosyltransferase involved in cell wall biosynthesis